MYWAQCTDTACLLVRCRALCRNSTVIKHHAEQKMNGCLIWECGSRDGRTSWNTAALYTQGGTYQEVLHCVAVFNLADNLEI